MSATDTRAPLRSSQRAIDNPVSPSPSTSTFLSFQSIHTHDQRSFRVDNPISTSIIEMIQNRTTT